MPAVATPIGKSVVDFIAAAQTGNVPEDVIEAARMCLVDWCGVALGATGERPGAIVADAMRDEGPAPVVSGGRASLPIAALINGTLAHTLDFDDTHVASLTHISGPTWAAILALAFVPQQVSSDVLRAFITGFEIGARLGNKIGPALLERRIHATAIIGSIAATAAGCAMLRLDKDQIANAMGLAATQAGGLTISFGTMAKPFHAGKAAMNAVIAVQLARAGFTASHTAFDDPEGLAKALLQDRSLAFESVERADWQILQNTFKPYASCLLTHASVDCARAIHSRLDGKKISDIQARVHPLAIQLAGKTKPATPLEGKFSLAFCISLGLAGHTASAADFCAARLEDPLLARLCSRVELNADTSLKETAAAIAVRLEDGTSVAAETAFALGNPENPMHWPDMNVKFLGLVEPVFGKAATALLERFKTIRTTSDCAALIPALAH
ncbi:MAG: MmgE/PrpD family protein [Rhizobiales bacterium]|nr:MmgE/PrpD family protein [Hyphomicrobiales bacterium]OJY45859.1 MAG: hypothetical protein BGP08_06565 [Rhizobiales bacterium 64-17]